ncbi:uncharacterized protein EAF02_011514 [Botrytis sinoallii]|uniref:uncharacterized protein n=1 Tax=Botrytis sinoallii TaxID=1463999 RepID=UPI0019024B6B|nr:uncharacterized protein EAF02_011514 [Botrytis sinoallii]KAF7856255.1 hypothetical protein EAF02_011514 [Botrytis sinoallii]
MPQVLPGDVTGLYYILVSNLPWSCTWQILKDFARKHDSEGHCLAIEHAQVYPGSTCGWVTVRGKEDFLKALRKFFDYEEIGLTAAEHLQGGTMGNRALCADGRNETKPIQVRDLAIPWTTSNSCGNVSRTRALSIPTSSVSSASAMPIQQIPFVQMAPLTEGTYISTSTSAKFNDRGLTQIQQIQSIEMYPNVPVPLNYPSMLYAGDMAPDTPVYIQPSPQSFAASPISYMTQRSDKMKIVRSKVIITQLPRETSTSYLKTHLYNVIKSKYRGSPSTENPLDALHNMIIEKHPDGRQKCHTFLNFDTHNMAQDMVEMLDGLVFCGKVLRVKLAKEGAETRERRQDIKPSKAKPIASRGKKAGRPKEIRGRKVKTMEERERDRVLAVRSSTVAAVAAVAARVKTETDATVKSPMVVNGSTPESNFR